jgi:hypothetical protein
MRDPKQELSSVEAGLTDCRLIPAFLWRGIKIKSQIVKVKSPKTVK